MVSIERDMISMEVAMDPDLNSLLRLRILIQISVEVPP